MHLNRLQRILIAFLDKKVVFERLGNLKQHQDFNDKIFDFSIVRYSRTFGIVYFLTKKLYFKDWIILDSIKILMIRMIA